MVAVKSRDGTWEGRVKIFDGAKEGGSVAGTVQGRSGPRAGGAGRNGARLHLSYFPRNRFTFNIFLAC